MISLPWSVVTALRVEPVGPIDPMVFGLKFEGEGWDDVVDITWEGTRYVECADYRGVYEIVEPRRVKQLRDALGSLVDSPTGLRHPRKTPWYTALCELHRSLQEPVYRGVR